MDRMLKLVQKMFGVVAALALMLGVLTAPIGEVRADQGIIGRSHVVGLGLPLSSTPLSVHVHDALQSCPFTPPLP